MKAMPIEYLEHGADMGVRATGATMAAAFCEAAAGMFALMTDIAAIEPVSRCEIELTAASVEDLLVEWLAALLSEKELTGRVFSQFDASIRVTGDRYALNGAALGETIDPARHDLGTEVKGITYLGLDVRQESGEWVAECVLDV